MHGKTADKNGFDHYDASSAGASEKGQAPERLSFTVRTLGKKVGGEDYTIMSLFFMNIFYHRILIPHFLPHFISQAIEH